MLEEPVAEPLPAHDVEALKQLALLGGMQGFIEISSSEFATLLSTSQQTASRRILDLDEKGLIRRDMGVRKQLIRLTEAGMDLLRDEWVAYQRLFELTATLLVHGRVASGMGEGQYYMDRAGYRSQFLEKLGLECFPGTLNVELSGPELNKLRLLRANPRVVLEEFRDEGRTFGAVYAWPATLRDVDCAVILPKRSHHTKVLEVVAAERLRDRLGLADHDEVEITVRIR